MLPQGRDRDIAAGAAGPLGALLPEVPGTETCGARRRGTRAGSQPQGERNAAAQAGEPGEQA